MAETIGDMIDKLTIANIKLWHIEDARREYSQGTERNEEKARNYLDMVASVNKERNNLIDQINAALAVITDKKESCLCLTPEDLLGVGKNKFYKEGGNE